MAMRDSDRSAMISQARINLLPQTTSVVAGGQGHRRRAQLEVRVLNGSEDKVLIDWH